MKALALIIALDGFLVEPGLGIRPPYAFRSRWWLVRVAGDPFGPDPGCYRFIISFWVSDRNAKSGTVKALAPIIALDGFVAEPVFGKRPPYASRSRWWLVRVA